MPYERNPFFTGREDILQQVRDDLTAGQSAALTQPPAISGLGGIGKTQIAVEYAYRYQDDYQYIFWVHAGTDATLQEGFIDIARRLGLAAAQESELNRVIEAVRGWLEENAGWLLILDNADDLALVRPFIPSRRRGHLLLTTRAAATGSVARPVRVEELPEEQGAILLLRRAHLLDENQSLEDADTEDQKAARTLAKEVDGLPLALDQAGAFIEATQISPAEYVHLYQERGSDLFDEYPSTDKNAHDSVTITFSLAFEKVAEISKAAVDLVRLCAFLAPDAIPEEIILKGAADLGRNLGRAAADTLDWVKTREQACRYSLLHRDLDAQALSIHRLVQTVLREKLDAKTQRLWAERAVRSVDSAFPYIEYDNWSLCEKLLPHALACAEWIAAYKLEFEASVRLLNQAGFYLNRRAHYIEAEPLYQQALVIAEKVLGHEHPLTIISLSNLADSFRVQGRYEEAESLQKRALDICEKVFGPEHPNTAISLNVMAVLYTNQGRYREAEPLYKKSVLIREKALGPEHPYTATGLNNLADFFRSQDRYEEAESLQKRALAIFEKALGPEHPDTATSLNNLAGLYITQGRYKEAEPLMKRSLAIDEIALGSEHPNIGISLNNLAELYRRQGRYEKVEPFYQRALAVFEKALGPEHPSIGITLENYARLLRKMEREKEAEELEARAKAIREKQGKQNAKR